MEVVDLLSEDSDTETIQNENREIRTQLNELKKYIPFLKYIHDLDPVSNANFIKIVKWLNIKKKISNLPVWKLKRCELTIQRKYSSLKNNTILPNHIREIFEGETPLIIISDDEDQSPESNPTTSKEDENITKNASQTENQTVITGTAEPSSSQITKILKKKVSKKPPRSKRGKKIVSARRSNKRTNKFQTRKRKNYLKMEYSHKKKINKKTKSDASVFDILSWQDLEKQNQKAKLEGSNRNLDYESPKKKKRRHSRRDNRNYLAKTPDSFLPDLEDTVDMEQGIQNQSFEDLLKQKMQLENELLQIEDKETDVFENEAPCVLPTKSDTELFQRRNSIRCYRKDSYLDPPSSNSVLQNNPNVFAEVIQNSQGTKLVYDYTKNVTEVHNSNATLPTQSKSNIIKLPNKITIDIDDETLNNLNAIVTSSPKSCEMNNNNICPKSISGDAYRKAMHQEQNVLKTQESMQQSDRRSSTHQSPPKKSNTKFSTYKMSCSSAPSCLNGPSKSPNNILANPRNPFKTIQVFDPQLENVNRKIESYRMNRTHTLDQVNLKSGEGTSKHLYFQVFDPALENVNRKIELYRMNRTHTAQVNLKSGEELDNLKQTNPHNVKTRKPENNQTKSLTIEKERSKGKSRERKLNQPSSSKTIEPNKESPNSKRNPANDDEEVIMSFPGRFKSRRRIESWSSSEDFEPSTTKTASPSIFSTPSKIIPASSSSSSNSPKISFRKSKDTRVGLESDSDQKNTKKENKTKPKTQHHDKNKTWKRIQIADHDDSPKKKQPKTGHDTAQGQNLEETEDKIKQTSQKRTEKENKDQKVTKKFIDRRLYRELSNLTCTFKESLLPATIGRRRCSSILANSTKKPQQLTAAPIQRRRQTAWPRSENQPEQKSEETSTVEQFNLTAAPIQRRRQTAWPRSEKQPEHKSDETLTVERVNLTAEPINRRRKTCIESHSRSIWLNIGRQESPEPSNKTDYLEFFNRVPKVALKRISESSCNTLSLSSSPVPTVETKTIIFNVDKNMTYQSTKTCALCNKKPKDLTNHYVAYHNAESYMSRLSSADIVKLEESDNFAILCRRNRYRITCVFCKEVLEESFENLHAHFSYHTGEYNFQCGGCKIIKPYKSDVGSHQQRTRMCRNSRIRTLNPYETNLATIYLHVCKLCNFGNINEANVRRHLRNEHGIQADEEDNIKKCTLATKDLRTSSDDISGESHSKEIEAASSLSPEILMEKLHAQSTTETKSMALDNYFVCKSPERISEKFHPCLVTSASSQSPEKLMQDLHTEKNTDPEVTALRSFDESTCKSPERLLEELYAEDSQTSNATNEALNQNTEMLLEDLQNSQTLSNIMPVTQSSNPDLILEELHDSNPITIIEPKGPNKSMPIIVKVTTEAPCEITEKILSEEFHAASTSCSTSKNTMSNDINTPNPNKHVPESSLFATTSSHNSATTQVVRTQLPRPSTETQSKQSMHYRQYHKSDPKIFGLLKCMMEDCLFSTNSDDKFRMHMLKNHIDYNETHKFDCPYCVEEIYSLENLMCHIWRQHGMSKYQCVECSYRSMVPGNVIIHRRIHHNDMKTTQPIYKCFSRETNKNKKPRAVYEKVKANVASLKCPDCSSPFYALASIKSHIQKSHPLTFQTFNSLKLNEFACIHCKRESNCTERMQIHMMLHHPDEPDLVIQRILSPEDCVDSLENLVLVGISPFVSASHIDGEETQKTDSTKTPSSSPVLKHSLTAKESPSGITLIPASTMKRNAKAKDGSAVKRSFKNLRGPLKNQQPKVKEGSAVKTNRFGETSFNKSLSPHKEQPKRKLSLAVETNKAKETSSKNHQDTLKKLKPKIKESSGLNSNKSKCMSSENSQVPLKNQESKAKEGTAMETDRSGQISSNNPQVLTQNQQPKAKHCVMVETIESEATSSNNPQVPFHNQEAKVKEGSAVKTNYSEESSSYKPQVPPKDQEPREVEDSSVEKNHSKESSSNKLQVPLKDQQPREVEDSSMETNHSEESSSNNSKVPLKDQQPREVEDSSVKSNHSEELSSNKLQVPPKDQQPREEERSSMETNHCDETSSNKPKVPSKVQQPKQIDCSAVVTANKCKVTSRDMPSLCDQQPTETINSEGISSNDILPFKNQQPESSVKPCEPVVIPATCETHHNEPSSPLTIVIDDDSDEEPIASDQMQIQSPEEPSVEPVRPTVIAQNQTTCLETKENPTSNYWNLAVIKEGPRIGPLLELLVEHTGIHSSTLYKCPLCIASFMHSELWLTHLKNKHKITSDVHWPCPYCNIELALDSADDHFQSHRRHEYICYYCIASFSSNKKIHEHFALCHDSQSPIEHKAADFFVLMKQDAIITDFNALLEEFIEAIYKHLAERIQRHTINEWSPGLTGSCFDEMEVPKYKHCDRPLFKCLVEICSFVGSDENSFDDHLIQHEVPQSLECKHCLFRLAKPNWESIKFHQHLHQSPSLYFCCVCKFVHYNIEGMTKHIGNLHNSRDVPVLCLSRNHFSCKVSLSIVLPQNEMTFTTSKACFCCSKDISNSSKLMNHLKKEHRISFCPRCQICGEIILTQFEAENHCKNHHKMEAFQLKYDVLTPYLYDLTVKSRTPLAIEMSIKKRNPDRPQLVTNESTSVSIKEEVVVVKDELQEQPELPNISLKCLNRDQLMANPSDLENWNESNVTESTTITLPSTPTITAQSFSPLIQSPFLVPAHSPQSATIQNRLTSPFTPNLLPYSFAEQTVATDMSLPPARAVQQTTPPTDTRYSSTFPQPHSIPAEVPLTNRSPSTASNRHSVPATYVPHSMANILYSSPNQAIPRVIHHTAGVQHSEPFRNSLYSSPAMQLQPIPNRRQSTTTIGQPLPGIQNSTIRHSLTNQPFQHSTPGSMDVRYSSLISQPRESATSAAPNLVTLQNSTPSTSTRHPSQHNVISEIALNSGRAVISIPPSAFQATATPINQLELVVRTAGTAAIPPPINRTTQTQGNSNGSNIDELVPFCGNCYIECSDFNNLILHYEAVHLPQQERFYFYIARKISCMNCLYQGSDTSFSSHHAAFHLDQLPLCCSVKDASRCGICNDIFCFPVPSATNSHIQNQPVCACPNRERVLANCLNLTTYRALQKIGSQYLKYTCDFCSSIFEYFHQYSEHMEEVHQQNVTTSMSNTRPVFYCSECTIKSYILFDIVHHIRQSHLITSRLTHLQAYKQYYRKIRICHANGFTIFIRDLCNTGEFDEDKFIREICIFEVRCQNLSAIT